MQGAFRRWLSVLAVILVLPSVASIARAQATEESLAAARSLASQGASAYEAGRYNEALDLFTRAESLVHAPPHILYMARSAEKLGNLVQAREYYIRIIREQLPKSAPQAFVEAQAAANAEVGRIEPRIASLVIVLRAPQDATPEVTLDGTPIAAALIGVVFPVDPGKHVLVATAPGMRAAQAEVALAEAEKREVELVLEPAAAPAPEQKPAPIAAAGVTQGGGLGPTDAPPSDTGRGRSDWMRTGAYIALGVGVVGIGAGTYLGFRSTGKRSDADDLAKECGPTCLESDPRADKIASLDDSARSAQTLSIVSFIVGGVGLASGVTLYVLSGRSHSSERAASTHWTPWIGLRSAGISGSF